MLVEFHFFFDEGSLTSVTMLLSLYIYVGFTAFTCFLLWKATITFFLYLWWKERRKNLISFLNIFTRSCIYAKRSKKEEKSSLETGDVCCCWNKKKMKKILTHFSSTNFFAPPPPLPLDAGSGGGSVRENIFHIYQASHSTSVDSSGEFAWWDLCKHAKKKTHRAAEKNSLKERGK